MTNDEIEKLLKIALEVEQTDEADLKTPRTPSCVTMSRLETIASQPKDISPTEKEHLDSCRLCRSRLTAFERHHVRTETEETAGRRRFWRWLAPSVAAAAIIVIMLVWVSNNPPPLDLQFQASIIPSRSADPLDETLTLDISVNQPAYIYVVAVDQRRESWVMQLSEDAPLYTTLVEESEALSWSVWRDVEDPAGPARTVLVMVIASHDGGLADSLDDAIPDLLPVDDDDAELQRYIAKLIEDLEARFDCVVRFERLPQP